MDYTEFVQSRFEAPRHLAAVAERAPVEAQAGDPAQGAAVALLIWPSAGYERLARVRFRAFGCPWLIAAADAAAEQFEGSAPESLGTFDPLLLAAWLDVPIPRRGRMLLIADAALLAGERLQAAERLPDTDDARFAGPSSVEYVA